MKYSIGDGKEKTAGWLTVDADPRVEPDIVATVPPLPAECYGAEAFRLIHVFEHFYKWDAEELLRQFFEALGDGGRLVLELPNLESAIDALSGKSGKSQSSWGMWVLYGDPGHRNPLFGHRWGWTPETLTEALRAAGFSRIEEERPRHHVPDRDFRIVAFK